MSLHRLTEKHCTSSKGAGLRELIQARILSEVEDARRARPDCHLTWSVSADEDGRVWLRFQCLTHGATWRYLEYAGETPFPLSALSKEEERLPCFLFAATPDDSDDNP